MTVNQLAFKQSDINGVAAGDFSNLYIWVDDDASGNIDSGETTQVGGLGVAGASDIVFSTSFVIQPGDVVNYILKGDVNNIATGDEVTLSLDTSNVTLAAGTVAGSGPASVIHSKGCTYVKRKKITIQASQVPSDLVNFPVMVKLTGTDFAEIEDDVTDPDGDDIIFRASDGETLLAHEIELFDTTNDELIAWVKVPGVSSSTDTEIYIYYGNDCVTSPTEDPGEVWSGYTGVWHLKETPTVSTKARDSSDNGNDGTLTNMQAGDQVSGMIDGSLAFDGSNNTIDAGDGPKTADTAMTVSFWMKTATVASVKMYSSGLATGSLQGTAFNTNTSQRIQWYTGSGLNSNILTTSGTYSTTEWIYVTGTWDGSTKKLYINGTQDANTSPFTGTISYSAASTFMGSETATSGFFTGTLDEVRLIETARSADWVKAEYRNIAFPGTFYLVGSEETAPLTAVSLLSFTASGDGADVQIQWETSREVDNMGFYLYRATKPFGPYQRLTEKLIPGLNFSMVGKKYEYVDHNVTRGRIYYYKLEDLDVYGKRTFHGPICVDWDADGMPDDWELAHGLDPAVNDALDDPDGDGLTNLQEFEHDTDPFNADTDGDGIPDGQETGILEQRKPDVTRSISRGVYIVDSDDMGITLELRTSDFDAEIIQVDGQSYEKLRVPDYVHGYTTWVGYPQMPVKGVMVDLPDRPAVLKILKIESQLHQGYRVYPAGENTAEQQGETKTVAEVFVLDEGAYSNDAFYPNSVAELGEIYLYRGQAKQQLVFYPLSFNPVSGVIKQHHKIRVRLEYLDGELARTDQPSPVPWQPPAGRKALEKAPVEHVLAGVMGVSPAFINPLVSALSSLEGLVAALWTPPVGDSSDAVYKIMVADEGIYRIDRQFLTDQGLASGAIDAIDLSQVRLYNLGGQVAIFINDQNSDGQLDSGDYIEFYGQPAAAEYAKYSAYNVYWLTTASDAVEPLLRMTSSSGAPQAGTLATVHTATVSREDNLEYRAMAPGADYLERWFFSPAVTGVEIEGGGRPVDYTLSLPGAAGAGTLEIVLYGAYDTEHEVAISVNGNSVGRSVWSGISSTVITIDPVHFHDTNIITIECLTGMDKIYVDTITAVDFERDFTADSDSLKFTHATGYRYQVSGFENNDLAAYDITSASGVVRVAGATTDGSGPYTLEFEPQYGSGDRTYLVLSADAVKTPSALVENTPSSLSNTANGADYILITHRNLGWDAAGSAYDWLTDLKARREGQGLRVKAVDIQDIYDEFSYGIPTPQALKDFISYAYTSWSAPAPQYVLLVGDGTRDPKNNGSWLITDTNDYLPVYLTYTAYKGETASDDWFVRISGDDDVADLYIGRLPAATHTEAAVMVDKILAYEAALNSKDWEKNVMLVADDQRTQYETVFETMNDDIAALLPAGLNSPFQGYLADYVATAYLTEDIKDGINAGTLLFHYSGHGAPQIFADERIFDISDVGDLTNSAKLPLFVSMSCDTGYFIYPEAWNYPSLAETLMRWTNGGAVAALMPTGMTDTDGQHILDTALFEALFTEDVRRLGPAVAAAKHNLLANTDSDEESISETFLLFGDPAMQLKVPLPRRPIAVSATGQKGAIYLQWDAALDCDGSAVAGYNIYRSTTAGGSYTRINTSPVTSTSYVDAATASSMAADVINTGQPYYYVVKAVDGSDDESVASEEVSAVASSVSGGGGGGGGCFITSAAER